MNRPLMTLYKANPWFYDYDGNEGYHYDNNEGYEEQSNAAYFNMNYSNTSVY